MLKPIISVLTVMAMMAAMSGVTASSAFADRPANFGSCHKDINTGGDRFPGFNNSEFNEAFNPLSSGGNQEGGGIGC